MFGKYSRQNNDLSFQTQRCPHPNLQNLRIWDLTFHRGLCRCDKGKDLKIERSPWLSNGSSAITRILRRGRRGGGRFDTEEKMQPQRQRSEWHDHKPRDAGSRERLEEAKDDGFSPEAPRRNTALLTRWFWLSDTDFGPLASKIVRINFCALKKYSLIYHLFGSIGS